MTNNFETYWGIDISKAWMDIALGSEVHRILQTPTAVKAFIKKYKGDAKILAVLESTGGYEKLAVRCLSAEGIQVHVAHPTKVNSFAKARGRLAKSDPIDAKLLQAYGAFLHDHDLRAIPSALQERLAGLSARLEQLKAMHHQESCRLGMTLEKEVKHSIQGVLKNLKKQIDALQKTMRRLLQSEATLHEKYTILQSMKGVGPTLAMKLITDLPELGEANSKEIAALVGVAPITQESGKKIGKARIKYGRCGLRKILYMGALVASRHHPKFQAFYAKLMAAGKVPKVALVAVMRKMMVVLNAMIRSKQPCHA